MTVKKIERRENNQTTDKLIHQKNDHPNVRLNNLKVDIPVIHFFKIVTKFCHSIFQSVIR